MVPKRLLLFFTFLDPAEDANILPHDVVDQGVVPHGCPVLSGQLPRWARAEAVSVPAGEDLDVFQVDEGERPVFAVTGVLKMVFKWLPYVTHYYSYRKGFSTNETNNPVRMHRHGQRRP